MNAHTYIKYNKMTSGWSWEPASMDVPPIFPSAAEVITKVVDSRRRKITKCWIKENLHITFRELSFHILIHYGFPFTVPTSGYK